MNYTQQAHETPNGRRLADEQPDDQELTDVAKLAKITLDPAEKTELADLLVRLEAEFEKLLLIEEPQADS